MNDFEKAAKLYKKIEDIEKKVDILMSAKLEKDNKMRIVLNWKSEEKPLGVVDIIDDNPEILERIVNAVIDDLHVKYQKLMREYTTLINKICTLMR